MARLLRGFSLVIIGIYLDGGWAIESGINSKKLATSNFLPGIHRPWIIAGDWNRAPHQLWQSDWPTLMGNKVVTARAFPRALRERKFA